MFFCGENVLWFSLWSPTTALSVCSHLFSRAVPNNYPLLQLHLRSAGCLHVAFRNFRESHSWGRAVIGHQRENQRTFCLKLNEVWRVNFKTSKLSETVDLKLSTGSCGLSQVFFIMSPAQVVCLCCVPLCVLCLARHTTQRAEPDILVFVVF